jgi:hypothetical protein
MERDEWGTLKERQGSIFYRDFFGEEYIRARAWGGGSACQHWGGSEWGEVSGRT